LSTEFLKKINPEWPLRLGLGLMYLYSGIDLILNPKGWTWALPYWYKQMVLVVMPIDGYLRFQGALELLMAFLLLFFFFPKKVALAVAAVSSAEILFILLFAPQFSITFRDIGVLGASLALFLILYNKNEIANIH